MDVYGLTGGIGSGKSTVADLLEEYGVPVVSADELSRIVVAKGSAGLADVVRRFGPDVVDETGELDRRKMASIVFQDTEQRRELEAILHPRIRERFEQVLDALEKAGHEVAVYEVPLLFEKNLQNDMKAVILVTAPESVRVTRVRARDDVTETEVRARIAAQMDEAIKRRRADYVIENDGSVDDLRREVEFVLARFLRVESARHRAEVPSGPQVEPLAADRPTEIPAGNPATHADGARGRVEHTVVAYPAGPLTEVPIDAPVDAPRRDTMPTPPAPPAPRPPSDVAPAAGVPSQQRTMIPGDAGPGTPVGQPATGATPPPVPRVPLPGATRSGRGHTQIAPAAGSVAGRTQIAPAVPGAKRGGTMRVPAVGSPEFNARTAPPAANSSEDQPHTQIAPAVVPKPPKKA